MSWLNAVYLGFGLILCRCGRDVHSGLRCFVVGGNRHILAVGNGNVALGHNTLLQPSQVCLPGDLPD